MKEFWNERFGQSMYIYGKAPNVFFAEQINKLSKGKLLLPAEGEGRNAVYAALKGWDVIAFDFSESGREKALKLASSYEISINYQLLEANDFQANDSFDAIAMVFAHFEGEERTRLFEKLESALNPGGHLIMEVFSKSQLGRESGGPQNLDLLYSKEEIMGLFPNLDFHILEETRTVLDEGAHHQGDAAVIRVLAEKKI
jgi:cyclopropane fatty-acyl-phospholipid synthase-like methyltransferase